MKFSHLLATTVLFSAIASAQSIPDRSIIKTSSMVADGSSCDPSVIAANIKIVQNVLAVKDLSETRVALNCYNIPCGPTLEAAIKVHCAKAEKLAEIADLLK